MLQLKLLLYASFFESFDLAQQMFLLWKVYCDHSFYHYYIINRLKEITHFSR